jgi:type I restriction-modification system DNA methylase subunit
MAKYRKMNDGTAATESYVAKFCRMTDALRGSIDAAEPKYVVLSLTFPKYTSDTFEAQHERIEADVSITKS